MNKRFFITLITLIVIIIGAGIAAFFAKGYTISPIQHKVVGTGIISVSSNPDGGAVYLDGHLYTATNATIASLVPKIYNIKIVKDGFIPWQKNITVQEGLVSTVKATLFPSLPTIYPLTYNGAINPILSPDGQKLVFEVPISSDNHPKQIGGIWVWTMNNQPIAFSRGAEPHQVVQSTDGLDFSKATSVRWSPDSKQILVTLQENGKKGDSYTRNYLLPSDQFTSLSSLNDITPTVNSLITSWNQEEKSKKFARIAAVLDPNLRNIASNAAILKWSPDETKFMVAGNKSSIASKTSSTSSKSNKSIPNLVYTVYALDTTDKNHISYKSYNLPMAKTYEWLPDSQHIILTNNNTISIVEYDGSNNDVIYAGNFEDSYVFPWPDSSRIVIVTTYPTPTGSTPNLYGINLK